MPSWLVNYGLAGLVIFLVIEKGYGLIKLAMNKTPVQQLDKTILDGIINKLGGINKCIDEIQTTAEGMDVKINWIKDVHDQKDADGVYMWYVRRSYEEAIQSLANSVTELVEVVKDLNRKH